MAQSCVNFFILTVLIGATCAQSALYELKENGTTCLSVNTNISVKVAYLQTNGKVSSASWLLGKSFNTTGHCDTYNPKANVSQIVLWTTGATLSLLFGKSKSGGLILSTASLVVNISDGVRFINPKKTGLVTLSTHASLPLSSVKADSPLVCRSIIEVDLSDPVAGSQFNFTDGVVIQAFGMKSGRLSGNSTECDQDTVTTTIRTTTPTPSPTTTTHVVPTTLPPVDPPLLNLTLVDSATKRACLRMRARIQFSVDYRVPGKVNTASVAMGEDAVAYGDCGFGGDSLKLAVKFFKDWLLTLIFVKSGSTYSMASAQLNYNLNNSAVFPYASDVAKVLTSLANDTAASVSGSTGNATYFACSGVSVTLREDIQDMKINTRLALKDLALQAFTDDAEYADQAFHGDLQLCSADKKDNIVPIAVGAALGGLVVIVLAAYLCSRRRQFARPNEYQSV